MSVFVNFESEKERIQSLHVSLIDKSSPLL